MKKILIVGTFTALMSACGGSSGGKGAATNPNESKIEQLKSEKLSTQEFNILTSNAWCGSGVETDEFGCQIKNDSRMELRSQGQTINQVTIENTNFQVMNPEHAFTIEGYDLTCGDLGFDEGSMTADVEQVNDSKSFYISYKDEESGQTMKEEMGFSKIQNQEISVVSADGEYSYTACQ